MRWIKENPTLAAGIGLPLVLIVLFSLAATIPRMLVEPPTYDVLFYADNYSAKPDAEVKLSVEGGQLKAQYRKQDNQYGSYVHAIYRYSAKTGTTRQIDIIPPGSGAKEWQDFSIKGASDLTLDSNLTAPDGYTFESYRNGSGGELASMFFMGSHYHRGPLIAKSGRTISIHPSNDTYYGYNVHFLGWVKE